VLRRRTMGDVICRILNPYGDNVAKYLACLPPGPLLKTAAREIINDNFRFIFKKPNDKFFGAYHQLAAQLGLYCEDGDQYFRSSNIEPYNIQAYMQEWLLKYVVPNPYTKIGFNELNPRYLYREVCQEILKHPTITYEQVIKNIFPEEETLGNLDILKNTINTYRNEVKIEENDEITIIDRSKVEEIVQTLPEEVNFGRNDHKAFFDHLNAFDALPTQQEQNADQVFCIYYGAPGTGKSYATEKIIEGREAKYWERTTFHPEYDYASFVGGYKPVMELNADGDELIRYKFVPQVFINIYVRAWKDPNHTYTLIIEEINRGNCAEIFGDIFQILEKKSKYKVSASNELSVFLKDEFKDVDHKIPPSGKLEMPPNLNIYATMNTSDQSLFPMDSAFKRRWDWEYMPICYDEDYEPGELNKSNKFKVEISDSEEIDWIDFIYAVNTRIKDNPNLGMDKCIGNYFVYPKDNTIDLHTFINKVIFYLWNDVFKDEDDSIFADKKSSNGITYEDFFPIASNGTTQVHRLLENLKITLNDGKETPPEDTTSDESEIVTEQAN
jgi:hypothetical protein